MTLPVRALLTQCVNGKGPDDYVFTREDGKMCETSEVRGRKRAMRQTYPAFCFTTCGGQQRGTYVALESPKGSS